MSNTRHLRSLILTLSILLCVAVLLLSVVPFNRVALGTRPGAGVSRALIERAKVLHFAVHIVGYGIFAWVSWFVAGVASRYSAAKAVALTLTLSLGFGTEYLQHVVYKHAIELNDVSANLLSSAVVFGLLALLGRRRKSPFRRNKSEREDMVRVLPDPD